MKPILALVALVAAALGVAAPAGASTTTTTATSCVSVPVVHHGTRIDWVHRVQRVNGARTIVWVRRR
ncbi:MAG: hypothetical protein JWM85_1068, partial [Acidimicrobiaceae bacterium]|nr:hypothetical protein [Acidimicrobiaceae bacterium]